MEPNLFDIATIRSLVWVKGRSLEEDFAVLMNTALCGDIHQNGWWDKVEFELPHFNGRVIQTVVGPNTEGNVALAFGMSGSVPFVDPILERMGFHGDFTVGPG